MLLIQAQKKTTPRRAAYSRELLAEFIGTFAIVFAGTGAVMVNEISGGALTHLGISVVFGAVVAAMIYTFGHISDAHFNPAVTLAFWSSGYLARSRVIPYIIAQVLGGILGSILLALSLGPVAKLGTTLPLGGNWQQSFILETVLTFLLITVILGSGLDRRSHTGFAGLAIGLTVGLEAAFMGPITGASMNPARSFAPALVSGIWQYQWIYWAAPMLGGQVAAWVYRYLSNDFQDIEH
ncbi:MAG: MIP/aquaporin family protein [Phormidesmis sp.]